MRMRSVVITGISRGLGAALFDRLVDRGDRVLAIGRTFTDAQQELADAGRVTLHHTDLAAVEDLRDACASALRGASLGVLLLNAAVVEPVGAVGAVADADLASAVAVNLTAPMVLTNAFLAARPAGLPTTVVFVSSGAAHRAIPGWAAYCATKAGAEMFFDVVAAEHPDVTVHNVNPGRMDTGMQADLRRSDFPDRDMYVSAFENGELPDPADVADRIIAEHLPG